MGRRTYLSRINAENLKSSHTTTVVWNPSENGVIAKISHNPDRSKQNHVGKAWGRPHRPVKGDQAKLDPVNA